MLVREAISFKRYRDPKEALGLGLYSQRNFDSYKELIDFLADNMLLILDMKKLPSYVLTNRSPGVYAMTTSHYIKLENYVKKYLTYHGEEIDSPPLESLYNELKERGMINEAISFQRYKDPKEALGLGKAVMIKEYLKSIGIREDQYALTNILEINTIGPINLHGTDIGEFPEFIQFNYASGDFNISTCNLHSLRGCPKIVNGYFDCSRNILTTLDGAPKRVSDSFDVYDNRHIFSKAEVRAKCKVSGFILVDSDI